MGNLSSRGPKLDKIKENGGCIYLRFGLCEMQGWRSRMEDATIASVEFDKNTSIFGVLDGHGGSLVSQFVASNFVNLITHMKSFKQKKYEQALIETYLKFDELLRMDKVNELLIMQYNNIQTPNSYQINFQFQNEEEVDNQIESPEMNNSINNKEIDKTYLRNSFLMENPVEVVQNTRNKNSNSHFNSDYLVPINDIDEIERDKKRIKIKNKKEFFLYSKDKNPKVEISLNKNSNDTVKAENFSKLVARDMGTTANILLIKNNMLYLANVGDSMAVLFKNGQAIRLNHEHKTTLQSEYTRVNKSGARIINNRIEGRLNLTRAIGDLSFKTNPDINIYEQAVTAYPQITTMKITKDCDFIIMACDGVWDCVDAQKLCEHVSIRLKSHAKIADVIADMFDSIISKTNNTPVGTDNMTCIVIQFIHND